MDYLFKKHAIPMGKTMMSAFKKGSTMPMKRFVGMDGAGIRRMKPLPVSF
jgi:hypothetical protein